MKENKGLSDKQLVEKYENGSIDFAKVLAMPVEIPLPRKGDKPKKKNSK
jgi:hypothetical protein